MILFTLTLCSTAPYTEEITYVRIIVRLGYPLRVREDYSVIVAGKRIRNGLIRVLPRQYGKVKVKEVYDNTLPMAYGILELDTGTVILLGDRCLIPGKHRITVEYEFFPEEDTLSLSVLDGRIPVPVDYVEVVLIPDTGSFPNIVLPKGFRERRIRGFNLLRITGDGPLPPGRRVSIEVFLTPRERYAKPFYLLVFILIPMLFRSIVGRSGQA